MSLNPTTIAPRANILMPNGVPQTLTTRRLTTRARTVFTGTMPAMDRSALYDAPPARLATASVPPDGSLVKNGMPATRISSPSRTRNVSGKSADRYSANTNDATISADAEKQAHLMIFSTVWPPPCARRATHPAPFRLLRGAMRRFSISIRTGGRF